MDNFILLSKTTELEELSQQLGFQRTFWLGSELELITADRKPELLQQIQTAKQKKAMTIYFPKTEEMLRFAIERTAVDIIAGTEYLNYKDSLHFLRGGMDQIICTLAQQHHKIIAFSFEQLLQSVPASSALARIKFNIALCQKYNVKCIIGSFARDKWSMRSAEDLAAFSRILGGVGKVELQLK